MNTRAEKAAVANARRRYADVEVMSVDLVVERFTAYLDDQLSVWRAHGPGNEGCSPHVANEIESIRLFWRNLITEFDPGYADDSGDSR